MFQTIGLRNQVRFVKATCCVIVAVCTFLWMVSMSATALAAPPEASWWDLNYAYRQPITITNNNGSAAVPAGYSSYVIFNHATLTTAKSQTDGDDIRIVYWNGTENIELDRVAETAWDTTTTQVWFALQASIPASGTDSNYYMYYGNASATNPPTNTANIYLWFDDFSTNTLGNYVNGKHFDMHGDDPSLCTYDATNQRIVNDTGDNYTGGLRIPSITEGNILIECDMRVLNVYPSNGTVALFTRYTSNNAHFYCHMSNGSYESPGIADGSNLNERNTDVASPNGGNTHMSLNVTHNIKYAVYGSQHRFWYDQVAPLTTANDIDFNDAVDNSHTTGNPGIEFAQQNAWMDNLLVRRYIDPEPTTTQSTEQAVAGYKVVGHHPFTTGVAAGATDVQMLRIDIATGVGESLTRIRVNSANSNDNDVAGGVSCYYTGTSDEFETSVPFGAENQSFAGGTPRVTFTDTKDLPDNTVVHLFVVYDVVGGATTNNTLDLQITAGNVRISGVNYPTGVAINPTGSRTISPPQTLGTITVINSNTSTAAQGADNLELMRIAVPVSGSGSPLTLTSLTLTSKNTHDADDIDGVSCYYTGTSSTFSAATAFGATSQPFSGGSVTFTGILDFNVPSSTHYLWIAYDVSDTAPDGHTLDAQILSNDIVIEGVARSASNGDPAGSRTVYVPTGSVSGLAPSFFTIDASPGFMPGQQDNFGSLANLATNNGQYAGADFDPSVAYDPQELWTEFKYDLSSYGITGSSINTLTFSAEMYLTGNSGTTPTTDPADWQRIDDARVQIYNNATAQWEDLGDPFLQVTPDNWDTGQESARWDNTSDTNPENPLVRVKNSGFTNDHLDGFDDLRLRVWIDGKLRNNGDECGMIFDYALISFNYGSNVEQVSFRWADDSGAGIADENQTQFQAATGQQMHLRVGVRASKQSMPAHYLALQYATNANFTGASLMTTASADLRMWNDPSHVKGDPLTGTNLLSGAPEDGVYHEDSVPPVQEKSANLIYEEDFTVAAMAAGTYYVRVVQVDGSGAFLQTLDIYNATIVITVAAAVNTQAAYDWVADASYSSWQGDNTPLEFAANTKYLLAVRLDRIAVLSNFDWHLQFQEDPYTAPGAWTNITTTSSKWKTVTSANKANQATVNIVTERACNAGPGLGANGRVCSDNDGAQLSLGATLGYTEFWYCIQADSTTDNHAYRFRVTNAGSTASFEYTVYPEALNSTIEQVSYRWADENEAAIASQGAAAAVAVDQDLHLRVGLRSNNSAWNGRYLALQVDNNSGFSSPNLVTTASSEARAWTDADHAEGATMSAANLLSGSPSDGIYHYDETQPSSQNKAANVLYEEDFTVRIVSAGTYYLRVVEVNAAGVLQGTLDTYTQTISITASTPSLTQTYYKWAADAASPSFAADNASLNFVAGSKYIVAAQMQNGGGATGTYNWRLQFQKTNGTPGAWTDVTTTSSPWKATNGVYNISGETVATGQFVCNGGAGTGTAEAGVYSETGVTSDALAGSRYTEYWYAVEPTVGAVGNTYRFRITNAGSTTGFAYNVYPNAAQVTYQQVSYRWADTIEAGLAGENNAVTVGNNTNLHLRAGIRSNNGAWNGHNLALQWSSSPSFTSPTLLTTSSSNVRTWDSGYADGAALTGAKLLSGSPADGLYHEDEDQPASQNKSADTLYEEDFTVRVVATGTYYLRVVSVDAAGANPVPLTTYSQTMQLTVINPSLNLSSYDWAADAATPNFSGADDDSFYYAPSSTYILAVQVENTGGASVNYNWQVQYQKDPYGTPGAWTTITTTSADWKMVAGVAKADQATVNLATESACAAGSGAQQNGRYAENNDIGATHTLNATSFTELWFAVQPQAGAANSEYRFRITNAGSSTGFNYPMYIESANLRRWNGGSSSVWGTAANWSPPSVPATSENVVIPNATLYTNAPSLMSTTNTVGTMTVLNGGTLTIAAGGTMRASAVTVSVGGTLDLTTDTSVLEVAPSGSLTVNGKLKARNDAILRRVGGSGSYGATIASGATLDVIGMQVRDLNASGLVMNGAQSTFFLAFEDVSFSNPAAGATQHLYISASTFNKSFNGCYFDDNTTYNVTLQDTNGGGDVLAFFGYTDAATNGDGAGEAKDNEINTAMIEWPAASDNYTDPGGAGTLGGQLVGFPVYAIDFSTFGLIAVYAVFNDYNTGDDDILYAMDENGNAQYSYVIPSALGNVVNWPLSMTYNEMDVSYDVNGDGSVDDLSVHVVYLMTDTGRVIQLVDNGSGLALPGAGSAWNTVFYNSGALTAVTSPSIPDSTFVFFGGRLNSTNKVYGITHFGKALTIATGTGSMPAITTSPAWRNAGASVTHVFFGSDFAAGNANIYRLDTLSQSVDLTHDSPTDHVRSPISIRSVYVYGTDNDGFVHKLDSTGDFSSQPSGWPYETGNGDPILGGVWVVSNLTTYFADDGGKVYKVNAAGSIAANFPVTPGGAVPMRVKPILRNNRIYVGNINGNVYVLNETTGATISSYTFDAPITNFAANIQRNQVMVGTQNGSIFFIP